MGRSGLRGVGGVCAGVVAEVVADAVNTTAAFRLFAKCGVQGLSELHRKERTALRLDWRHLPSLPCPRSASRCDWKTGTPGTGRHPIVTATAAQKLRT